MSNTQALTTPNASPANTPQAVLLHANELINYLVQNETPLDVAVKMFRTAYVESAVILCGGNQCAAARLVSAHRNTITRSRVKS